MRLRMTDRAGEKSMGVPYGLSMAWLAPRTGSMCRCTKSYKRFLS